MRALLACVILAWAALVSAPVRADAPVPRVVLALYDGAATKVRFSSIREWYLSCSTAMRERVRTYYAKSDQVRVYGALYDELRTMPDTAPRMRAAAE